MIDLLKVSGASMVLAMMLVSLNGVETATGLNLDDLEVGTLSDVTFNGGVLAMESTDDGKLYVLDEYAVWLLDVDTKEKTFIAGSADAGYQEGVGDEARFEFPVGIIFKQSTAYIADARSHCITKLDLITRNTSRFAGTCGELGFDDGPRLQAHFHTPTDMIFYKSGLLVTDYANHAIRYVEMDGNVSSIIRDNALAPLTIQEVDEDIYYGTDTAICKLDFENKTFKIIAGSKTASGLVNGPLLEARFLMVGDMISPYPGLILVTDMLNNQIRVVDLANGVVSSICTAANSVGTDGGKDNCTLIGPYSLVQLNDIVYIGQYTRDKVALRTLSLPLIQDEEERCPADIIDVTLGPHEDSTKVFLPGVELLAPLGQTQLQTKLSDGTTCNTTVNVITAEVVCSANVYAEIPSGETTASVTWSQPSTSGIEDGELECIRCPSIPQELTVGVHTIEYAYSYVSNGDLISIGCSFDVLVSGSSEDCSSEINICHSGLSKGKDNAVFNFTSPDGTVIPIEFPPGTSYLEIESESGNTCTKTFEVQDTDTNPIRSSVDLTVNYAVNCDELNSFSWAIINSSLLHHYTDLVYACEDCDLREVSISPDIRCEDGILSATWQTNHIFPNQEDTDVDPWPAMKAEIVSELMEVQQDHMDLSGRYFVITVIMRDPPVVTPLEGQNDLYLYPEVVSTCGLEQLAYDYEDDACYNAPAN